MMDGTGGNNPVDDDSRNGQDVVGSTSTAPTTLNSREDVMDNDGDLERQHSNRMPSPRQERQLRKKLSKENDDTPSLDDQVRNSRVRKSRRSTKKNAESNDDEAPTLDDDDEIMNSRVRKSRRSKGKPVAESDVTSSLDDEILKGPRIRKSGRQTNKDRDDVIAIGHDDKEDIELEASGIQQVDSDDERLNSSFEDSFDSPGAIRVPGINAALFQSNQSIVLGDEELSTRRSLPSAPFNQGSSRNPLVAEVVEDEESLEARIQSRIEKRMNKDVVDATRVQTIEETGPSRTKSPRILLIGIMLVAIGIVGAVSFLLTRSKDNGTGTNLAVGNNDNKQHFREMDYLLEIVSPIYEGRNEEENNDGDAKDLLSQLLEDVTTPQYLALEWLAYNDTVSKEFLSSYINGTITTVGNITITKENCSQMIKQRYAVALFYFATDGPNSWIDDMDFLTNTSVCSWRLNSDIGIFCDNHGIVVDIRLANIGLNGTLPFEVPVALTSLEYFSATYNSDLHGTIPSEFGLLRNLRLFQLFQSPSMKSSIPDTFANLRKLEYLVLADCGITGSIPQNMLMQLTDLEYLYLQRNFLTGTLNEFPSNHNKLAELKIFANLLEGSLPLSLFEMSSLKHFDVTYNNFTGTISTTIGQLSDLEVLHMSMNNFSGSLPSELGLLTDLEYFVLFETSIGSSIPSEIAKMTTLKWLVLEDNNLTGGIPPGLSRLSQLEILSLMGNDITGTLTPSFASLPSPGAGLWLANTSLAVDGFDAFCNQSNILVTVEADCHVRCTCCTSCYDDILEETHANHTQNCNIFANTLLDDQRGVTCNCVEGGRKLVCNETCQACNRDGTTCATNVGYGYEFDEDGIFNTSFSTFRYDTSTDYTPVDTVNIEVQSFTSFCKVFVNGELCRSCDYVSCVNGFEGYYITCDNIEGVGNFNPCGMDYEDVSIPLNIFAFQDPFVRDGCEPLLWPPSLF